MKKYPVKQAMAYLNMHMGRPCRMVDWRRFTINYKDVLIVIISVKHNEIPRTYRLHIFVDGEPAGGFIL